MSFSEGRSAAGNPPDSNLDAKHGNFDAKHSNLDAKQDFSSGTFDSQKRIKAGELLKALRAEQIAKTDVQRADMKQRNSETRGEVLDGHEAADLASDAKEFTDSLGNKYIAATDKGIDYPKPGNEDRVVIRPDLNFAAVIDGMGGHAHGERGAEIIAEHFYDSDEITAQIVEDARQEMEEMKEHEQWNRDGGACFISGRICEIEAKKFLEVWQSGDCALVIQATDGSIKFESADQTYVQDLVDNGIINADQALYHVKRNNVRAAIMTGDENKYEIRKYPLIPLESGDRIILMSDGISDNLTLQEFFKIIKGLDPKSAMQRVSDITGKRMQDSEKIKISTKLSGGRVLLGEYADGYKGEPKPDNRALVIIDIAV